MHSNNYPPENPVNGPKYLQRPPDPLKDGSIFHMGLGMPRIDGSRSQSATRQPPSLCPEAVNGMGGQSYTPAASTRGSPGRALFQSPATEQLSRSEIARQIRANFDNLVRASPLPRAVERLVTPSAARLAALAPPWLQSTPGGALREAQTPQRNSLEAKPRLQLAFPSPGLARTPGKTLTPAPLFAASSAQQPASTPAALGNVIRPTPVTPSFGRSPDALYTPRPVGSQRDPRLMRKQHAQQSAAAEVAHSTPAQPVADHSPLPPACQSPDVAAPGISSLGNAAIAGDEPLERGRHLSHASMAQVSAAKLGLGGLADEPAALQQGGQGEQLEVEGAQPLPCRREQSRSDSGKTVTVSGGTQDVAGDPAAKRGDSQLQTDNGAGGEARKTPKATAAVSPRFGPAAEVMPAESSPASASPKEQLSPGLAADERMGTSNSAQLCQQSPGHAGETPQAHIASPGRVGTGQLSWATQAQPQSLAAGSPAHEALQDSQHSAEAHASAGSAPAQDDAEVSSPRPRARRLSEATEGEGDQEVPVLDKPASAASLALVSRPGESANTRSSDLLPLAALTAGAAQPKNQPRKDQEAPSSQKRCQISPPMRGEGAQQTSRFAAIKDAGGVQEEPAKAPIQVSRTGRIRAPPLAFWANERISRNAHQPGSAVIEQGFSDQLTQACQSFTQSLPVKKPKQISHAAEPSKSKGREAGLGKQQQTTGAQAKIGGVKRKHLETEAKPKASAAPPKKEAPAASSALKESRPAALAQQPGEEPLKPSGPRPRNSSCKECRKSHKGHCGTDRAVKSCLRRKQPSTAEAQGNSAAAGKAGAGAIAAPAAAQAPVQQVGTPGRTLGIAARLEALARRPITAQAGQLPSPPGRSKRTASLKALQQHRPAEVSLKQSGTSGQHAPEQTAIKKQKTAGKQASSSGKGRGQKDAGVVAKESAQAASGHGEACQGAGAATEKIAGKRKPAKKRQAQPGQAETDPKAASKKAGCTESNAGGPDVRGRGRPKKLRRLAISDSEGDAKQAAQGPDPSGNASSGTSNEEDIAQAEDGGDWSEAQIAALQRAYLIAEDPTAPNFWRKVAQHVPGKTAEECLNRIWAAHPTPTVPRKGREADSDDEPLLPPPRAHAAGGLKRPPPAATRKWARQVRWRERASQAVSAAGGPPAPEEAQPAARAGANPTLLAAMQQQQRTDRYIDALIRKRGPLHKWAKGATGRRLAGPARAAAPMFLAHPELQGTVAAIASAAQDPGAEEVDEEASDHDQYWSDE